MKKTIKMMQIIICFLAFFAICQKTSSTFAATNSGECGNGVKWHYSAGTLTISGSGAMSNYSTNNVPGWSKYTNSIKKVIIKEGVTTIGTQTFANCKVLAQVQLPDTLRRVGSGTFYGCQRLKSVSFPEKVTEIPNGCFVNCGMLEEVSVPGAKTIAQYAFQNTAIIRFTLGKNVKRFSSLAFFGTKIESYQVEQGNGSYLSKDGVLFSKDGKRLIAFPSGKPQTTYTVPSTVTTIGNYAFFKNQYLTKVKMGKNVTTIKEGAFDACQSFTSVSIPDSVTKVGDYAYFGCPKLTTIKFGKGLKKTSYQMFRECKSLKNIVFGSSLEELGAHTFAYCNSLTKVSLPENIKVLGPGAFGECRALKSFASAGLRDLPYAVFWNCKSLSTVKLGEGMNSVSRCAFYQCTSLKKVTMPKSVTFVHSLAFPDTTKITCKNKTLSRYGTNGYRRIQKVSITGTRDYKRAYQVLKHVNAQRKKNGLAPLSMNKKLLEAAMNRATEITLCFSHTRPDGSAFTEASGWILAENIAAGQKTAKKVMNSWMNSQGHKDNILSSEYSTIGIGCYYNNGVYYWVQCFGTGNNKSCKQPKNSVKTQTVALAVGSFSDAEVGTGINGGIEGTPKTYRFSFGLYVRDANLMEGETTMATLYTKNAGSSSFVAKLNNTGVKWTVSNPKIAKVSKAGQITAQKKGTVFISGKLTNYKVKRKMKVLKKS